jgi:uncharacterized protein YdeI (BOF family)
VRAVLSLTVTALLLAAPALAQDTREKGLTTDQNVQQSQQPQPNEQGVRSPSPETSHQTQSSDLQQALAAVRAAPPDLQGNPVKRPNGLGSNPDMAHEPTRSENPSDLSSQEVK